MVLESDSTLHEQQLTEQQQKMADAPAVESENQVDEQQLTKERSASYRILATFSAHDASDSEDGDQADEDPMAWADLEAFGGTKKTLERKPKPRQLTPEEVHEQLQELHEIDAKMAEARNEKRSKKGMLDTIAWLKKHQHASDARRSDQRRLKRSSSFVRSVLGFFQFGNSRLSHRHSKQDVDDDDVDDNNTSDVDDHALPSLQAPWGQTALNVDWTEIGFALLNQAVLDDIARVRPIVQSGELLSASPQALIALSKWLRRFDQHVDHVLTLKEYLLEERTLLAGVGYKVTTMYDIYKEALGVALEKTHGDRRELGTAILQVFADLETILRDEQLAVKDVVQQSLTQDQEYEALSSLFHNLSDDDSCGVVLAKLLGWMKNHMDDDGETQSFLEQFDEDVKDRLAGEWMRQYAIYLELLDSFSVNFEGSMAYFTQQVGDYRIVQCGPSRGRMEWLVMRAIVQCYDVVTTSSCVDSDTMIASLTKKLRRIVDTYCGSAASTSRLQRQNALVAAVKANTRAALIAFALVSVAAKGSCHRWIPKSGSWPASVVFGPLDPYFIFTSIFHVGECSKHLQQDASSTSLVMEVSVLSSSANGGAAGLAMAGMALPDILLDGDRLNMLLDIICTDYITASYASRENGKKVVLKALQKLYLSVYASAPHLSINIRDSVFADRSRAFYEELLIDFDRKRHQQLTEMSSLQAARPMLSPSLPIVDDAIVKEVLKPKLVQFVEEIIKERDRHVRSTEGNRPPPSSSTASFSSSSATITSSRTTIFPGSISNTNASSSSSSSFVTGTIPGSGPLNAGGLHSTTWQSGEIRMEGWLRKKGQHVNLWRDRYFMIRSTPNGTHYLCYFRKKGDKEPRGWYILGPGTTVDEVRESPSKIETKPLFTFRIRHLTHAASDDVDDEKTSGSTGTAPATSSSAASSSLLMVESSPMMSSSHMLVQTTRATGASFEMPSSPDASASGVSGNEYDPYDPRAAKKPNSRRFRSRAAAAAVAATAATAVVLTGGLAGVGIGMGMGMSAAAAASAGAAGTMIVQNRNKGPIALAAESLETAIWWRNSILECIAQAEEQWKRYLNWYMDKDHELQSSMSSEWMDGASANTSAGDSDAPHFVPLSGTLVKPTLTSSVSGGSVTTASVSRSGSHKSSSTRPRAGSFGTLPRSIAKTFRTSATFSQETSWKLYDFSSKLRVDVEKSQLNSSLWASLATTTSSKHAPPPPALRTSVKVLMSPQKVFDLLMDTSSSFYRLNHVLQQAQVLEENKGDHSDVVYWRLAPTFLWPVYVESRDLCLLRYWRKEQDASYFICFQSTTHTKCPSSQSSSASAVRGSVLGGGFIISPRVHTHDDQFDECWVTLTIQMNPKGWIDSSLARSWYYMHAYGVYFLEMITALSALRPDVDTTPRPFAAGAVGSTCSGDPQSHSTESHATSSSSSTSSQLIVSEVQHAMLEPYRTELTLKHALPPKFWSEPDATSFLVRGPQYFVSRTKVRSAPQAFRLVSVELLKSGAPSAAAASAGAGATTSAAHEKLKIQRIGVSSFEKPGLADCPLLLVINFMLPGPPNHSLVLYFTPGNPAELKKNSVFADLCHDFCRGASDEFRTKRLKLIPRIVQGTWSIREGVGSTPAILGTKVSHSYHQGTQFLEVDYDISSSTVASGIVKMLMGYARDLVIDLAFVIEAQSSLELPERVLGCVRLNGIDLRHAVSYVPAKAV